jgi:alanine racemase
MTGLEHTRSPDEGPLRPTWYEIDLAAFRHNVGQLRSLVRENVAIYACLKRNAYGCGAGPIARAAVAAGVDGLAVGNIDDAVRIRHLGVEAPILLYPNCLADAAPATLDLDLMPTLSAPEEVENWDTALGRPHPVFAKFDVGLFRGGAQPSSLGDLLRRIAAARNLRLAGLYTHFHSYAGKDDRAYMDWQVQNLRKALAVAAESSGRVPVVMAASSSIVVDHPELDLSGVDPGRLLYGVDTGTSHRRSAAMRPVVSALKTRLLFAKTLAEVPDDPALAPFPVRPGMRIGILPVGWGDGLPRRLQAGASALVRGRRAPLLNPVHLEHLRIDLTRIPEAASGDEVALVGTQGGDRIGLADVQAFWGMDPLTFLASMRDHIPRRYLDDAAERGPPRRRQALQEASDVPPVERS